MTSRVMIDILTLTGTGTHQGILQRGSVRTFIEVQFVRGRPFGLANYPTVKASPVQPYLYPTGGGLIDALVLAQSMRPKR